MKVLVCYMTYPKSRYYEHIRQSTLYKFLATDDRFHVLTLEGDSGAPHLYVVGDILHCPNVESYQNLNLKTFYMLVYANIIGYDYVIKIDDDVFLDHSIDSYEFLKHFLIADYSGIPIVKSYKSMVGFSKRFNSSITMANNFTYTNGLTEAMAGPCYGLSRRAIVKMLPIIENIFINSPCAQEDHMVGEAFNRICREHLFSKAYLNPVISGMCQHDPKTTEGIVEFVNVFHKSYKVVTKGHAHLPKISCICPTFGRTEYLQEAVHNFLSQDYPNKELIVLNDNPRVQYVIKYPCIITINMVTPFDTLGEKRNWMINAASGKFIVPWDDDDLHLPGRISALVNGIQEAPDKPYFVENGCYSWDRASNTVHACGFGKPHGGGYAASIFNRVIALSVGGYSSKNINEDCDLFKKLRGWYGDCYPLPENPPIFPSYVICRKGLVHTGDGAAISEIWSKVSAEGVVELTPTLSIASQNAIAAIASLVYSPKAYQWNIKYNVADLSEYVATSIDGR